MDRTKLKLPELLVDEEKKANALKKIRMAAESQRIGYHPSAGTILRSQLSYLSKGYWLGQGLFALAGALLFFMLHQFQKEEIYYLFYASVLSACIGIVTITELSRSQSFHMGELEESCYFNLGQIWGIKMAVSGSIDVCILTGVISGISRNTDYGILALTLYLMVPFVLSHGCYLLLLFSAREKGRRWSFITAAVLAGLGAMIPGAFPKVYQRIYLPVWGLVFLIGLLFLGIEIYSLLRKLEKGGEKICWN